MNVVRQSSWLLAAGFVMFATLSAAAQRSGSGAVGEVAYDPATEVTLRGMVQEVKPMKTVETVTHLTLLKADHSTIEVHLGPSSWMAKQSISFRAGDQIEVIGSRVTQEGSDVIVARQIRKGKQTLTLRDMQGISQWSLGR